MWTTNPELASNLLNPEDGYRYMQSSSKRVKWKCNTCNSVFEASPNSRNMLSCICPYCSNRKVNHTNSLSATMPELALQWHPTKNGDMTPHDTVPYTSKKAWWICEKGHEWEAVIASRRNGCGCPICSNKQVLAGYNDLWTVNPNFAKLLANCEEGYEFVQNSNKKVDWKCPDCYLLIRQRSISNVYKQGLRCPSCTDYVSFPEKVMTNVLRCFDIKFKYDSTTTWSNGKRYDFYIPSLNLIIETHGGQHFGAGFENMDERSLKEIQENDLFKKDQALNNGIEQYIVIDCRRSSFDFIKNNIMKSQLVNIFDFTKINWNEVLIGSNKSFKNEILQDWNSGIKDVKNLSEKYSIDKGSIVKFLKEFASNGLCDYSPTNFLYMLDSDLNIVEQFNGLKGVSTKYPRVTSNRIRRSLKGRKLLEGHIWILCRRHELDERLNELRDVSFI